MRRRQPPPRVEQHREWRGGDERGRRLCELGLVKPATLTDEARLQGRLEDVFQRLAITSSRPR